MGFETCLFLVVLFIVSVVFVCLFVSKEGLKQWRKKGFKQKKKTKENEKEKERKRKEKHTTMTRFFGERFCLFFLLFL